MTFANNQRRLSQTKSSKTPVGDHPMQFQLNTFQMPDVRCQLKHQAIETPSNFIDDSGVLNNCVFQATDAD